MVKPADKPMDRLGREIKVGDYVVHAASYGSSATMNFGKVIDLPIKVREICVTRGHRGSNNNWVPPVMDAEEYHKAKVQPCEKDGTPVMEYDYDRVTHTRMSTGKPVRAVTIEYLDRMAVVSLA